MDEKKVMKSAIDKYGAENQLIVAIEEMSELQKEICKHMRGIGDKDHIAEELADARIMLEQIEMIFSVEDRAEVWRQKKLERLLRRLQE